MSVSSTRYRIVPATKDDVAAISNLAGVIWRRCYPGIITQEQIEYMLGKMYSLDTLRADLRAGIQYPRLFEDHEFIGFASFGPSDSPDCFKLHKLYLHPDWHRRGLGSCLLDHCEREAGNLGALKLVLNVNQRNLAAIAVYQKKGFRIADSVVLDIGNGFVMDDYIMEKKLPFPPCG